MGSSRRIVLVLLALAASAQQVIIHPTSFVHVIQVGTTNDTLPTSLTCVIGTPPKCAVVIPVGTIPYVCAYSFSGAGQRITVQDSLKTLTPWFNAVLVNPQAPGEQWTAMGSFPDSSCLAFPSGVYWAADKVGASGVIIVKY
jgi:hypothetical protein